MGGAGFVWEHEVHEGVAIWFTSGCHAFEVAAIMKLVASFNDRMLKHEIIMNCPATGTRLTHIPSPKSEPPLPPPPFPSLNHFSIADPHPTFFLPIILIVIIISPTQISASESINIRIERVRIGKKCQKKMTQN